MSTDIFTVSQTAQYLQVCEKTVRRLISKNELVASKIGNSWRIQKQDIDNYLKKNQNNSRW